MEIKEIEQVKKIPYGISLEDWLINEGVKIESYLQNDKANYEFIVDKMLSRDDDCCFHIPKNIYILDYKTKRFESAKICQDETNQNVDEVIKYYFKSITESFYNLKDWKLPKEKEYTMKDLKKNDYFCFFENMKSVWKFLCIDENMIIVRNTKTLFIEQFRYIPDKTIKIIVKYN